MRKLMEYHIISGRTVETRRTWLPTGPTYRKPRGQRRAGASSLKKIKANEKSCALNLARTINCNFEAGDWFCTFKYDDAHYPASRSVIPEEKREEEYQTAKQIFTRKFLPKFRKEYRKETGKALAAVWVTANWSPKQMRFSRIHHHAVIPTDGLIIAERIWNELGGLGATLQAEHLGNEGDYTSIAAYMAENVRSRPSGENRWSACRGMAKPVVTEPKEVADMEHIEPIQGSIIKDVRDIRDEDGCMVSKYMRCVLPEKVEVRGGQILLPGKRRRRRE